MNHPTVMATAEQVANIVDRLRMLARSRPGEVALRTIAAASEGEPVLRAYTYRQFDTAVRALAAHLQARFPPGSRLLVALDNDEPYARAMFACFYAGMVAVPVFAPEVHRPQHAARLAGIADDACAAGWLGLFGQPLPDGLAGAMRMVAVDTVAAGEAALWRPHSPQPEELAFLQYTSGSTSAPKGVEVSHGNLWANEQAIHAAMGVGPEDHMFVWSPLFHDMGLIGGLLLPFFAGIPCLLSSPDFFLERPSRWLQAISTHRVTISGGPDFAYRLCLDRIKDSQLSRWDLSSWRVAYTGAEPVREATMQAFAQRFAGAGFDAAAIYPCYGLAEATLMLSGGRRGDGLRAMSFDAVGLAQGQARPAPEGPRLVACGDAVRAHALRITDPVTFEALVDGRVGEIWATGPSIAQGYWQRPGASAASFVEHDGRRWLRTGDLGFRHEGQLYIAGRLKDMVVVRGHNVYPQDVEAAVETGVPAVRKGRVAAFAVQRPEGDEGLGLAVEVPRQQQRLVPAAELVAALSAAVQRQCGEPLSVTVLLQPGGLPRTTSGKLQRGACRQAWQDGSADAYAIHAFGRFTHGAEAVPVGEPPRPGLEAELAALWREVLGLQNPAELARNAHFFMLGGQSVRAAQLAARISAHRSVNCSPALVFEHPTLAAQALAVAQLQAQPEQALPLLPLPEAQRDAPRPLSSAQARQCFLWQLDPSSAAYHLGGVLSLEGPLDLPALHAALNDIARQHEVLRSHFDPAHLTQQVQPFAPVSLLLQDLRGAADPATARAQAVGACQQQPFDLRTEAPWRALLLQEADARHALVLVLHHIAADGTSMAVLLDTLSRRYNVHRAGAPVPALSSLPVQVADHAAWQNAWLQQPQAQVQRAYWQQQLGDDHPVLQWGRGPHEGAPGIARAGCLSLPLPERLASALRCWARQGQHTPFMLLLAAYQWLLYRHSGQQDIRVGVPVAHRPQAELQGLIGLFVNTVVLRGQVHGGMTVDALRAQARSAVQGALAHQDLPFEAVVQALQPSRSPTDSPLFQVMFNLQHEPPPPVMQGLAVQVHRLPETGPTHVLCLDVAQTGEAGWRLDFHHDRAQLPSATVQAMADSYLALLAEVLAEGQGAAQRRLGALAVPAAPGPCSLANARPLAEPVHLQIARRAAQHPEAIAWQAESARLRYGELQRRVDRLAAQLLALALPAQTVVAVALPRSPAQLVALLGILRAGGVYLPLDPGWPPSRLVDVLGDSGARWVLTETALAGGLRAHLAPATRLLCLDTPLGPAVHGDGSPSPLRFPAVHAQQLAYLIATSGTTGKPKTVAVSHGELAAHLAAMGERCALTEQDVCLQFAPASVDAAIEQWLLPLLAGSRVVCPPEWPSTAAALVALCEAEQVSVADLPPAYLRALLQPDMPVPGRPLRLLLCGGEAWDVQDLACVRERLRPQQVLNAYGPTEAVITPTAWLATEVAGLPPAGALPIGQALGPRQAWVLDDALLPVPPGVAGELYLGGLLARGYFGQPGLTAERFVPDPFDDAGGRLYRTGDRACWRADGELAFLGRVDHQVKLRGWRLELGEIEAALCAQPGVREALVGLHEGTAGPSLVAAVVMTPGQAWDPTALRQALRARLPEALLPQVMAAVPSLPLTLGGKRDRRILATLTAPDAVAPASALDDAQQAQAPEQAALARLWAEVLGLPRVGLHDNFFDLGGNSLLLMRLHGRLVAQVAPHLSLMALFAHPTVAALAAHLGGSAAAEDALVPAADSPQTRAQRQLAARRQRQAARSAS